MKNVFSKIGGFFKNIGDKVSGFFKKIPTPKFIVKIKNFIYLMQVWNNIIFLLTLAIIQIFNYYKIWINKIFIIFLYCNFCL